MTPPDFWKDRGGGASSLSRAGDGVGAWLVAIGASILFPKIQLEHSDRLIGDTETGAGASVFLGKEWGITRSLTLGGMFRVAQGTMKDQSGEPEWTTTAVGANLTMTWAPKGVGWRR